MDLNTKRYNELVSVYKKAYPDLKPSVQLQKAQALWNMVKADAKKYEEALVNLQRKKQSRQSKQLSFWSNLKSKPPQKPVEPSISFPSQSTSQPKDENPSEVDKPVQDAEIIEDDENNDDTNTEKKKETPAQDKLTARLNVLNESIVSLVDLEKKIGLTSESKNHMKSLMAERETTEKKIKRLKSLAKSQQKLRSKRKQVLKEISTDHPEVASKLKKLEVKTTAGRPNLESQMEGLHEAILSIIVPGSAADERRRSEVYNSVRSLDDLKNCLEKKGYKLSRTATYYRLLPANVQHKDGKRHVHTVPVKLQLPQNDLRKKHPDGHFAMASVMFAREIANLFGDDHVFFLSQDDKARVPLGLPISKKQTAILMHLEYKVVLPDHDFPIGEKHKLIPSVYAACVKKDGEISYNGPTFVSIRSGKHDKSCAETHSDDFERVLQLDEFKDAALTPNNDVKPLVFISVDGGPDEAPKNHQALSVWARQFENNDLDAVFVFTHAPGSSAYNPVERRMAPLSKDTAGVILPFDKFGSHLDASNKTIDPDIEIKNFEAAGKILAEIWSESVIDKYPVIASYTCPPENEHREVLFHKSEEWKAKHVRQSQYMLQIVKCSDKSCCKEWRTNYIDFFPQRFLPPPIPIGTTKEGLEINRAKGSFRSLFQSLFIASSLTLDICYDEYCPSLQKTNHKGERIIERRTCKNCKIYHSTISAMKTHKRICKEMNKKAETAPIDTDESDLSEAEDGNDIQPESTVIPDDQNIFEQINSCFGL